MHNIFSNFMHILSFKINLLVAEHFKNHIKLIFSASYDIVKYKGGNHHTATAVDGIFDPLGPI